MSNVATLYVGNDTVLEVKGLKNEVTGAFLNAATVTATLSDSASGAEVSGQSWPVTLAYVAGSDGDYRATLSYAMSLTANGRYTASITADAGAGLRAQWSVPCRAQTRQE